MSNLDEKIELILRKLDHIGFHVHRKAFFGASTGLLIECKNTEDVCFLTFIKKKADGTWEKTTEGRVTAFSWSEMLGILKLLRKEIKEFRAYHKPKSGDGYNIQAYWDKDTFLIGVPGYLKPFTENPEKGRFEVTEFMTFWEHITQEKIESTLK